MVTVITKFNTNQCEEDFALALATEEIAKMASDDVSPKHWWANVVNTQTGELIYQCWWQGGMLHTWHAATNTEDESILFL